MHREFPPIAFLAALFLLIPLPSHWRARNVATLSIIFWLFVCNIIYGADAITWGNNVKIVVPVWCDITSKIIIGANFALPAACLCICIHLEQVASVRLARVTQSDKRRRQIFEALMCFGLPVLFMGLHYVVQGHRFDIIEEYGCRPTTYISIPGILIVWVPPLILAALCLVFAALALRHFIHRRITFSVHLAASHSALTTSRYLRLILMSVTQMFWSIIVTAYTLWFTVNSVPMRPWTTWSDVHSNFSRIDLFVTAFTPQIVVTSYYVLWWLVPASSFIFVAFFAFGKDAIEEYKAYIRWIRIHILRQKIFNGSSKKSSFVSLPIHRTDKSSPPVTLPTSSIQSSILPPYKMPSPPSPTKCRSSLDNVDYNDESCSSISHYTSLHSTSISVDTYSRVADVEPSTPSTIPASAVLFPPGVDKHRAGPFTPLSPPSPLIPPFSSHTRPRVAAGCADTQSPTSAGPLTYPSHDASYLWIDHDTA